MQMAEIEARFKIHDLFTRYMRAMDNRDEKELFACFTEDGVMETPVLSGRFAGREGQRELLKRHRKIYEGCQLRHCFTNLEVELDGDHARARAYLLVSSTREGKTTILNTGAGHYDCRLVKVADNWLFEYRRVFIDSLPE